MTVERGLACLILAAGKGTRMRSARPKVLHAIAGRPMLSHVVESARAAGAARIGVVIGPGMSAVEAAVAPLPVAVQQLQAGTGDAVRAGLPLLDGFDGRIVVLYGDTPLVRAETIAALAAALDGEGEAAPAIAVLGFRPRDPGAYGRLITGPDGIEAIVEHAEATPEQRAIGLCNAGLMAFRSDCLRALLPSLAATNAKGEYYLTDLVGLARAAGRRCVLVEASEAEVMGVNTRVELAAAEAAMQARLREAAMLGGATLIDPASTFLSADTILGQDVTIGPSTVFGPGVVVEDEVEILGFCHLEGAILQRGARVGPFARLRPGTIVEPGARIGNFVEMKATRLGAGAKANHLAYLGDSEIGAGVNIGAGTITANYDGFAKHRTAIGAGASIGANVVLVAPVSIGVGAMVGAGSVVTRDVPEDALAVARARQEDRPDAARRFREARLPRAGATRPGDTRPGDTERG